ncbi:MAG: 3'(2'),5'-bisphosphate nucleotidase CysQ [Candidatus Competibacterales bacterium]
MDFAALVDPIAALARRAGERIQAIYRQGFTVAHKDDRSLLTDADLAAHDIIVGGLQATWPEVPVLSEEDAGVAFDERRHWEWLWLVDPLDGTWQFVHQCGEFTVNIALIHRHQAVFGLILVPVTGISYWGFCGGGAFKAVPGQAAHAIRCRPRAEPPVCVAGSRAARGSLRDFLRQVGEHDYYTVGGALKSCLVAEGEADLYARFGPTSEWDTAAAQIIVEEAGGRLTDTAMRPLRYNARPSLINPNFFAFGDPRHDWSQYLP